MLSSIFIENYALIDKLEIEFHKGLSIITGETGAGKSILIGALGLLLGKRADGSVLKDDKQKCIVEGLFLDIENKSEEFFLENDLDYSEEIVIRREIANTGKSRAFINDTPVNLNVLQELTLSLVDIHSQHHSLLLNKETYIQGIIDSFAGTISLLHEYKIVFSEYRELKQAYYKARESYNSDKENLDYISHQFLELSGANLKENELSELESEFQLISHAEEIKFSLVDASNILENDDSGLISNIKNIKDSLSKISKHLPEAEVIGERMNSVYIELKDLAGEISLQNERIEFDAERMQNISERIDFLYALLRKYKSENIQNLITIKNELDSKLQKYSAGDFDMEKLSKNLEKKEIVLKEKAIELSERRKKSFPEFESKVLSLLVELGMKHVKFSVHHESTEPGENGIDKIQLLFSANKNVSEQSIGKVASGGELSRLMLAIKSLIAGSFGLPTIIFDEIDSGVSGEIADKVGNLIKQMSIDMQVINITHLPQVASKGDHHYLVYKTATDGKTGTFIKQLNEKDRLNEIAKMLSGDSISNAAIENAKVLLKLQ